MTTAPPGSSIDLRSVLRDAPSAVCLVAVNELGELVGAAGAATAVDAGAAVSRLWAAACRAAASRSPAPLDHLVVRTMVGDAVVVRAHSWLLAAIGRPGTRPDGVAYELRRAVDRPAFRRGSAADDPAGQDGAAAAERCGADGVDRKDDR